MLETNDGLDAISGRKRAGIFAMAARMVGVMLLGFLVVMTVYILL